MIIVPFVGGECENMTVKLQNNSHNQRERICILKIYVNLVC